MNVTTLEQCLNDQFNLRGDLTELYSYEDSSYLLKCSEPSVVQSQTRTSASRYVVKVMRVGTEASEVEMQTHLLCALQTAAKNSDSCPRTAAIVTTKSGDSFANVQDDQHATRLVWVVEYLDGVLAADQQPYTEATLKNLGIALADLHADLATLDHSGLDRESSWTLTGVEWVDAHREAIQNAYPDHGHWLTSAIDDFLSPSTGHAGKPLLDTLTHQPIHGDINEHNVLFTPPDSLEIGAEQQIAGIIDFGDAHKAPRICDLAVACTYFMMNQQNPWLALQAILTGYHSRAPLLSDEMQLLMPLVRMRLVQSLTQSMLRSDNSNDIEYVTISQRPALALIDQLNEFHSAFATWWVRHTCGDTSLSAKKERLVAALGSIEVAPVVEPNLNDADVLDLSPGSGHPADPFSGDMPEPVSEQSGATSGNATIGRYGEPRLVYQSPEFKSSSHPATSARTIHAGVDVFLPAGSEVFAPCDGQIHAIENRTARQDYGPVIVLRHELSGDEFFTLYGHLDSECLTRWSPGQAVRAGESIARIGAPPENGDWPPHLHFQWVLEDLGWHTDINGVCHPYNWSLWRELFPNPAVLLGCEESHVESPITHDEALAKTRRKKLGSNLALSYTRPVQVVRGWQQYLYDQYGQCYLDAYNNVPHVGHCHPHVVKAITSQLETLSTNTRYLHTNIVDYAEALTAKFDDHLDVCFVLNSASEANELALRLARNFTNARDMIVMDDAYHGHTTSLVDISPYKAEGRGGEGCPDWVHKVPAVDLYRGRYRYNEPTAGALYADDVKEVVNKLTRPLCGFIVESLPSVGGQLVYPQGYLNAAYAHVRAAGGLCIADEVQTGFGRTGDHFWGFEQQNADPDIVVLGKPIGNGFPLAAVITTSQIAEAFDNGMEFFSTFGGNTVACAAGLAVLEIVEKEGIQAHIKDVGDYLVQRLKECVGTHPYVGDIRGMGLFLGIELVTDRNDLTPATKQTSYVKNRLRDFGILIGSDGPYDNVLKIRPPSPFSRIDADYLVDRLAHVLQDTALSPS